MAHAENPLPEILSGHNDSGAVASAPHLAFVGLPFVGHQHAHGNVLGLAIVFPSGSPLEAPLAKAVQKFEDQGGRLDGDGVRLTLRRLRPAELVSAPQSIYPHRWNRAATTWRTVTPIALPRHPGNLSRGTAERREKSWSEAESIVRLACTHIGLPAPTSISLQLEPFFNGSRHIAAFPPFIQGNQRRMLLHAELLFPNPVHGPLIIGSGRFRGLGLCLPVNTPGHGNG